MKPELKKLLVLNLPYLLFVYLFAKCGQAYRLAAGADASAKLLHLTDGISAAFANPLPSLHPFDLCVGVAGAVAVRLIVYSKGKNAKKYRKGEEYGSARKVIRIAGDDYPAEVVKSRFMKLDSSHVQYVMDCMKDNTTYVRNIKKYLLAALYNAPATINSYYSSLVQHDMYGDGQRGRG